MFNSNLLLKLFLLSSSSICTFYSVTSYAFPENVRHGYTNCTTCHISPNGGGLLTSYSRELSKEMMSSWGFEGEGRFGYKFVTLPEWLSIGGDVRALQYIQSTPSEYSGRWIWMQLDAEIGLKWNQWTVVGTFGEIQETLGSRRHYILYQPTENLSLRAGRFFSAYGINIPEHTILTRILLGYDEGSETYNFETAWIDETKNFFITGILGRPDQPSLNREKGGTILGNLTLADHYKIGLQYYYGSNSTRTRQMGGLHGILGFTPHFYLLTELDLQASALTATSSLTWGMINYQKLGYEITQGLHFYLTQEMSKLDFNNSQNQVQRYGLGMQWLPRPHFELNFTWLKQMDTARFNIYTDQLWLLFHYYL